MCITRVAGTTGTGHGRYIRVALLAFALLGCGEPASTQSPIEGTPNVGGEAPKGAVTHNEDKADTRTGIDKTLDKAFAALQPNKGDASNDLKERVRQKRQAAMEANARQDKRSKLNDDPSLAPAKKLARDVAAAIIAKDVEGARKLFIPAPLLKQIFPGDACTKQRASGEKERQRIERKIPGIHRRAARFLIYGPDNLDGKVEPAQEAKVSLTLGDVTIRRSKTIEKGKTSKRGCTMNKTLIGTKVRLKLQGSMDGKTVDVPINIQVLNVGQDGWFLAEL